MALPGPFGSNIFVFGDEPTPCLPRNAAEQWLADNLCAMSLQFQEAGAEVVVDIRAFTSEDATSRNLKLFPRRRMMATILALEDNHVPRAPVVDGSSRGQMAISAGRVDTVANRSVNNGGRTRQHAALCTR
jgi:hypothetical protein